MYAELFRQQNCLTDCAVKLRGNLFVGVNGVAVAGKGAYLNIVIFDKSLEIIELSAVFEQLVGVGVRVAGVAAAADFNHFYAE